jgi:hypothetical protein
MCAGAMLDTVRVKKETFQNQACNCRSRDVSSKKEKNKECKEKL